MSAALVGKWVGALSTWLCWVSALCILGMTLLTSSDVALRYVGLPIKGTYDVVGLLGALVVALPIAHTQVLNRHVSMEFMAQRVTQAFHRMLARCVISRSRKARKTRHRRDVQHMPFVSRAHAG